mmetsp:Transcript_10300/g.19464  ORF Transcript_10300/g.19464 Transcript_10300/m.19464 type:complete len:303 (-) Transcript_10300:79-987(-)
MASLSQLERYSQVDYYGLFEIEPDADSAAIRKAYRKAALKWHPDKNKDQDTTEKFKLLTEAFSVLSCENSRREYDRVRRKQTKTDIRVEIRGTHPSGKDRSGEAHSKSKRPKRYNYFSSARHSFADAKRMFEEFLKEEEEWDPQEEQPFYNSVESPPASPTPFESDGTSGCETDPGEPAPPKRAKLNPAFLKAKLNQMKRGSNLGRRTNVSAEKHAARDQRKPKLGSSAGASQTPGAKASRSSTIASLSALVNHMRPAHLSHFSVHGVGSSRYSVFKKSFSESKQPATGDGFALTGNEQKDN